MTRSEMKKNIDEMSWIMDEILLRCDDSDGNAYGTIGTTWLRDLINRGNPNLKSDAARWRSIAKGLAERVESLIDHLERKTKPSRHCLGCEGEFKCGVHASLSNAHNQLAAFRSAESE